MTGLIFNIMFVFSEITFYYFCAFKWSLRAVGGFYSEKQFKLTKWICFLLNFVFVVIVILTMFAEKSQFSNGFHLKVFFVLQLIFIVCVLISQWVHIYAYIKRKENLSSNIKLTITEHMKDKTKEELLQLCYIENRFVYSYNEIQYVFNKEYVVDENPQIKHIHIVGSVFTRRINVNEVETVYYWDGDVLVGERTGSNYTQYVYDANGIAGMRYNGSPYYFEKNLFGDVIRVYNGVSSVVAEFKYSCL